jgi:hypothetical protein
MMLESEFSKRAIRVRRDRRDMLRTGWEYVGEGGGMLWELYRGSRMGQVITDVRIAADGLGVWIKTAKRA